MLLQSSRLSSQLLQLLAHRLLLLLILLPLAQTSRHDLVPLIRRSPLSVTQDPNYHILGRGRL